MMKIAAPVFMTILRTFAQASSLAHKTYRHLAPITFSSTKRFISHGQTTFRNYSVKDHEHFDQLVINSDHPVIVDFHAEWCEPCHVLTPLLKGLLAKSEHIDLAIVDVEANKDLVETFDVKAVPAVLAFYNGVIVDKFIGLVDEKRLESLIGKLKGENRLRVSQ